MAIYVMTKAWSKATVSRL